MGKKSFYRCSKCTALGRSAGFTLGCKYIRRNDGMYMEGGIHFSYDKNEVVRINSLERTKKIHEKNIYTDTCLDCLRTYHDFKIGKGLPDHWFPPQRETYIRGLIQNRKSPDKYRDYVDGLILQERVNEEGRIRKIDKKKDERIDLLKTLVVFIGFFGGITYLIHETDIEYYWLLVGVLIYIFSWFRD